MNTATLKKNPSIVATAGFPLEEAILFIQRASIRPVIRQELKTAGIDNVMNVETAQACDEALLNYPNALLVIDWDHGSKIVNKILRSAQGSFKADTRPIFLIASEISRTVVATGTEYNVTRV